MAKPLLDIHGVRRPGCEYPVVLKVAMDDGTVQEYALVNDVSPCFKRSQDILTESISISIGYQFKPKKRRNRTHRGSECGR